MRRAAIEWLSARALEHAARDEVADPVALMLLLRRYLAAPRPELGDAIGAALARALAGRGIVDSARASDWLTLLVEAAALSDDERIEHTTAQLVDALRAGWARLDRIEPLTRSIGACLAAAQMRPGDLVRDAIDGLERAIGATYRPGDGLATSITDPRAARGRLGDHVRAAAALLTAHALTDRLPYAMLADELMQFARRHLWDAAAGGFFDGSAADSKPFAANCDASRVLFRLAALHESDRYRAAAVLAPDARYREDAEATLDALSTRYRQEGAAAALYGIALTEALPPPW